jgi:hypothetical protein
MPTQTLGLTSQELLRGRYIAALGTENADGTIHLTAVWYLEDGHLFIATSSKSRKARNIAAQARASLMVDVRKPGAELAGVYWELRKMNRKFIISHGVAPAMLYYPRPLLRRNPCERQYFYLSLPQREQPGW